MFFVSSSIASAIVASDVKSVSLNATNSSNVDSASYFLSNSATNAATTTSFSSLFSLNSFFPPEHFKFIFGDKALQDSIVITIQKSDIPGLTASTVNTAESLFVGLINIALSGKDTVELPGISFKYWGYSKNGSKQIDTVLIDIRNKLIPINGYEIPEISLTIDPDDYL